MSDGVGNERALELAEACANLTGLFARLRIPDPRNEALGMRATGVRQQARTLGALAREDPARVRGVETLRAQSESLARDLREMDDRIPFPWLRQHLTDDTPRELLEGYAIVLAVDAGSDERRDRIDFIMPRLLSTRQEDGQREPLPEAEVTRILARVAPEPVMSPHHRESAMTRLSSFVERLEGYESFDELFSDGLYADIKSFKAFLAGNRLDPAVLYAAALLSIAIANHIARTGPGEEAPAAPTAADDIDAIYGKVERDVVGRRFEAERLGVVSRTVDAVRDLRPTTLGLALVTLLVGALAIYQQAPEGTSLKMRSASSAIVSDVSDLLTQGGFSRGDGPRVFIGELDPERWWKLTPAERAEHAARIGQRLADTGVNDAIITVEGRMAVQLLAGRTILGARPSPKNDDAAEEQDAERSGA